MRHRSSFPVANCNSRVGDLASIASLRKLTSVRPVLAGAAWGLFEWNFYSPSRIAIWSYCMTPVINLW